MKKRVLSALLALCLTLSLAGAAFAENEPSGDSSSAVSQAVSSVESEPQTQDETVSSDSASGEDQTAAKTESSPAPTETPAASDVAEEEPESTPEPEAATESDTTPAPTEDPVADVTENEESDGSVEYTAALETDGETMNVIVTAPEGAFAEDVQPKLSVTMLTAEDELNAVAGELDTAEVQYDGFAALDITFTDEATGEEVEPVKSVTVRIELPQTIVDSGVDLTTLAVQHLEEDENGNVQKVTEVATLDNGITLSEEAAAAVNEAAGVAPVNDMPAEEATAGDAAETPAAVAEFEVNGFSDFAITWENNQNRTKDVTVICYDADTDSELPDACKPEGLNPLTAGQTFSFTADNAALKIDGYEFVQAEYYSYYKWRTLTSLTVTYNNRWRYSVNGGSASSSAPQIRLYYRKSSDIQIEDTILTNGSLSAVLADSSAQVTSYTWYRSAEAEIDGGYAAVEGETSNTLFVARDGARHYYYVVATLSDGRKLTSAPFQITYYDALQNGSFEKPDQSEVDYRYQLQYGNSKFMQIPNGTEGLIWQTTASGKHFNTSLPNGYYTEIVKSTNGNSADAYGIDRAAEGDQFAELNCETAGALYQDVLTVPGSTLYWGLEHSDRKGGQSSRLLVLISDTSELPEEFDPTNYDEIADLGLEDNIVLDVTSDEVAWKYHSGSYVVPEGQYVTRFYFVAGNGSTEGNLLDNITFSSELPKPPAEKGNIVLNKAIAGIDSSAVDLSNVNFTFTITTKGQEDQTVTLNAENNWTQILTVDPGSYTITENGPAQTIGEYTYQSTTISGGTSSGLSTTVEIAENESELVVYTNTYEQDVTVDPVVADPDINKSVDDNEDGTYDLSLDVKGTTGKGEIPVNVLYVLDESYSMMWTMDGSYPGTAEQNPSGDNKYPEDENQKPIDGETPYAYSYIRFNAAKQAIERLNGTLNSSGNLDARVAMVTFAQDNNNPSTYVGKNIEWLDPKTATLELPASQWETFASGTNYYDALTRAQDMIENLESDRKDAETVVIFVTDGEPNWPREDGKHEDIVYAKQQAEAALAGLDCDRFYAVGVGSDIGNEYLADLITNVKDGVAADSFQSGDTSALVKYFNQIAADIAGTDLHNVTITDTLSDYAELVDVTAVPTVTVTNADEEDVAVTAPSKLTENGIEGDKKYTGMYSFTDGDKNIDAIYTYNSASKTFTLEFPETYQLTKDWKYAITVQIKPTDTAYQEYGDKDGKYPEADTDSDQTEGDENTGITSAGKPGFYSNTEATLTYDSGETEDKEKPYPMPVIQVKTGELVISKSVSNNAVGKVNDVDYTFTITPQDDLTVSWADVSAKNSKGADINITPVSGSTAAQVTVTGTDTVTISGLPLGDYKVQEDTGSMADIDDDKYYFSDESYAAADNVVVDSSKTYATATVIAGDKTQVNVTNEYKAYKSVTLTKEISGTGSINTDEFTFTVDGITAVTQIDTLNSGADVAKNSDTGVITVRMTGGKSVTINKLKENTVLTITESDSSGYTPSIDLSGVDGYSKDGDVITTPGFVASGNTSVTLTVKDATDNGNDNSLGTVKFINTRNIPTPTGLEDNHTKPFGLMVGVAVMAGLALAGGAVVRRRRRWME